MNDTNSMNDNFMSDNAMNDTAMIQKIDDAIVPIARLVETHRGQEGGFCTGIMIEVAGEAMILASKHDHPGNRDYNRYVATRTESGAVKIEPGEWYGTTCFEAKKDLNAKFLTVPDEVDESRALDIEAMMADGAPKRGETVRSLGWGRRELGPQLREGIVSVPRHDGVMQAEMMSLSGGSGSPVWTEDGIVGTTQGYALAKEERYAQPGEDPEELARFHAGLTDVHSLTQQIKLGRAVARQL